MNKYQEALDELYKQRSERYNVFQKHKEWLKEIKEYDKVGDCLHLLQELVDKATPKKLKSKTDKDGRLLWVCPNCGDIYMKFWSDVETISCRKHCDECGQAIDWSDIND